MIKVFKELKELSVNGIYNKTSIEFWLHKNDHNYKKLIKDVHTLNKEFPNAYIRNHNMLQNEAKFLDTYEVLLDVLECYENELYHKEQMAYYNRIKNDELEFNSWLQMHKLDEGDMQTKFKQLFQNTSKLSGYEFIIRYPFDLPLTIKVDELDFKNTIQFINIIQ